MLNSKFNATPTLFDSAPAIVLLSHFIKYITLNGKSSRMEFTISFLQHYRHFTALFTENDNNSLSNRHQTGGKTVSLVRVLITQPGTI